MPKISVIIPIYNVEEFLPKCIESVCGQSCNDLEIILVNDGSTDRCGAICDEYAAKDSRIKVIHQRNRGVSAARNAALVVAEGQYIGFVDGDDYIHKDTYQIALEQIDHCDMVMWDAITQWDDGHTQPDTIELLQKDIILNKEDLTPALLGQMAGSVCRCLYRRELLWDLRFPEKLKLSEDQVFNLEAMGSARKIAYLKQGMYIRFVRKGSAVYRCRSDVLDNGIFAMKVAKKALETYWGQEYLDMYIRLFLFNGALVSIYNICSKAYTGKSRLRAIGQIAGHPVLKEAFQVCPPRTLKERWLHKEAKLPLLCAGIYFQWKHGQK